MWTRKELKQQAKEALQRNYWRVVLVTLLLGVLGNTNLLGSTSSSTANAVSSVVVDEAAAEETEGDTADDAEDLVENNMEENVVEWESSVINIAIQAIRKLSRASDKAMDGMPETAIIITGIIIFAIALSIALIIFAFTFAIISFLINPFIVGAQRFMLRSLYGRAEVKEVAYAFDHSYLNVVKVMFCTQFSIFLWSFLLIIPGLYKQYQYRMVEYIMAEHPDLHYKEAMRLSREMMNGEKWNAFVLDLSFIFWKIVGVMTCGIAYLLFVGPYQYLTNAALYRKLCELRMEHNRNSRKIIERALDETLQSNGSIEHSGELQA